MKGGINHIERVPLAVLHEILVKLDLESLCSAAPVCRTLRLSVSLALSSLSKLDFSEFSPDAQILRCVLRDNKALKSLTLDCRKLNDSSVDVFARGHLQELVLLRCSGFSSDALASLGKRCPDLRLLMLEMVVLQAEHESSYNFQKNLTVLIEGCLYLESLCLKFQGSYLDLNVFAPIRISLPKTIKILQLQPMSEKLARKLVRETGVDKNLTASKISIPFSLGPVSFELQTLSLNLDKITDKLLISISLNLGLLMKLELQDKPVEEPLPNHDLSNSGLQSLVSCSHLTHLSLVRSRENCQATFKRVNDMGIFFLAEGCKNLESVTLGGFSRVTDAGFISILQTCKNLSKFEISNAFYLSDLTFHDLGTTTCSLIHVRLSSCSLITSETAENLSLCKSLEVLDLRGCRSIADSGLRAISSLSKLTTLNLSGADITDTGLSILGYINSPIVSLSLRGCKRISDRGMALLLLNGGVIVKTLSAIDLGHIPGISDRSIFTILEAGAEIKDLCIRYCFSVTCASIAALARKRGCGEGRWPRRIDLCNCNGLSLDLLKLLEKPLFPGLIWLGLGRTCLSSRNDAELDQISNDRPGLRICLNGCEMDCYDGWEFHGHL